jgi:HEAT repeat protein
MKNSKRFASLMVQSSFLALLASCLAFHGAAASEPILADRVEALREALATPVPQPATRPQELNLRREAIQRCAALLRGPAELRQALLLHEWLDDDQDETVAQVDRGVRNDLFKRFDDSLHKVFYGTDRAAKLAALTMVAEFGIQIRGPDKTPFGARLAPELVLLMQDNDPEIRQASAHALGQVIPAIGVAVPALDRLLKSTMPADRQAAGRALVDMVRVPMDLTDPWHRTAGQGDIVATACAVLPLVGRGLGDPDSEVRRLCAGGIRQGAIALNSEAEHGFGGSQDRRGVVPYGTEAIKVPTPGELLMALQRLATGLKEQTPMLAPLLQDPDLETCVSANEALEAVADTRLAWQQIRKTVAPAANAALDKLLLEGLRPAVTSLAEELSRKETRIRLAAFYVLESLGPESAPAAGAVVATIKDPDSFIRWAAARTLAKMAPAEPKKAVAGLAELTADPNGDVRGAALSGLRRYGSAAKDGVPALSRALQQDDPGTKLLALQALAGIGPGAEPAVPALTAALSAPQAELRAAAARALGKIGPAAASAEGTLIKMLQDPDADVRQAAGDAVLMIK